MATQKPISTISYNTESFLRDKLEEWLAAHIIQAYQYICHKGENGDKDHIHLRVEPNKKLDPMDLSEQLKEFQLGKEKPLGCRPWRPSKEEDWYLYAVHDEQYLNLKYGGPEKGEKLPYSWEDIRTSDNYDVEIAFIRAKAYMRHTTANIATRIRDGQQPIDLILGGENVFTVNAINRALAGSDVQRLQVQIDELADLHSKTTSRLALVLEAIESIGITCSFEDGRCILDYDVCRVSGAMTAYIAKMED